MTITTIRRRVVALFRTNADNEIVADSSNGLGNRMPGIARNMGFASFGWQPEEIWYAGANQRYYEAVPGRNYGVGLSPGWIFH